MSAKTTNFLNYNIIAILLGVFFSYNSSFAQCTVSAGVDKTIICAGNTQLEGAFVNQSTLFTENFESYSDINLNDSSTWKVTNGTTGEWAINTAFNHSGSRGLGTKKSNGNGNGNGNGLYGKYDDNFNTTVYYTTKIDATNISDVRMSFYWKGLGEEKSNSWVDYGQVAYSFDGTTWHYPADTYKGIGSSMWAFQDMDLSMLDGQQFYIGFKWNSDNNKTKSPGFTIDDITITGNKSATITWSPSTGLDNPNIINPVAAPSSTTTYTLTVNDGNGCNTSDQVVVNVTGASNVDAGVGATICEGSTVNLNATITDNPTINTLFNADFNHSSNGFTVTQDNNNGNVWNRVKSFTNGSETITSGGTYFYKLQSDWTGDGSSSVTNSYLTSPVFSTTGYDNISISFRHYFRQSTPSDNSTITFEYSTNDSTWNNIVDVTGSTNNNHREGTYNNFKTETLNIPALNNQPTVYIRFHYKHSQDWSWSVDDIKVNGVPMATSLPTTYAWSPTSSMTAGVTTLTPTVKPPVTTDYVLTVTKGGCQTLDSARVVVDQMPTVPTSLTISNNTNNCWGAPITLTAHGGVLEGVSQYVWGNVDGGTTLGTTASETKTLTPTDPSLWMYYVGVTANGTCPAQFLHTGVSYVLPTRGNSLSVNNESATCYVTGNNPIHFYSGGRYIGSINPNGRIGTITMTSYIHSIGTNAGVDDGTIYACNSPLNELYRTAFMERSFTVVPTGTISGSGDMDVYLPFTGTEFSNLTTRAANKTAGNVFDDISSVSTIVATKYHHPGSEDGTPNNNCLGGTSVVLGNSGTGTTNLDNYGVTPSITADYARFKVNSFSEFYLHGQNKNSPLPIELTAFSGNCVANGIELTWTTATETNVNHFEILRSRDGISWNLLANVPATGNSSVSNTYSTLDVNGSETLYYRLRSVDNDGTAQEYAPLSVVCHPTEDSWSVYPNPTHEDLTVNISSIENKNAQLSIMNMEGKLIYQKEFQLLSGTNVVGLDTRDLAEGMYVIRWNDVNLKPIKFTKF